MIKYRTIDGKAIDTRHKALDYDLEYIKQKNVVLRDSSYKLYKINNIDELIPLAYGKYRLRNIINFPVYIIENSHTNELTLATMSDLNDAITSLIMRRKK